MIYLGAQHYFFWLGVKAAVFYLGEQDDMGPNLGTKCQGRCLDSYMDGFVIGLNLTKLEYKEMLK